jgi:hypothetical protein
MNLKIQKNELHVYRCKQKRGETPKHPTPHIT